MVYKMTWIKDILVIIGSLLGIVKSDQANRNDQPMKTRKTAQNEVDEDNKDADAIDNQNVDAVRDRL